MAEWIVVITPFSTPNKSSSTLITGTIALVVHEAADTMLCCTDRLASFTPKTIVASISLSAGCENKTRFAPAARCFCAFARHVNEPEHSSTISTLCFFQSSASRDSCADSAMLSPLTISELSCNSTEPGNRPCVES